MTISLLRAAAIAALSLSVPAVAQVAVTNPYARATPPLAKSGAAYLTLTNKGSKPDRLLGGSTPVASMFELHETSMAGGIMRMRAVPNLTLAPGQTVTAKPGGLHVMLMGLKRPLVAGQTFPATLRFEKAGAVNVTFKVEAPGAR